MPIYHDGKKMKPYRGYRKPVNVYYGDKKVAGWKNSTQTGNNLTFQTTYNDTADVVVKGKTLQKSEWVHKQGLTTQDGIPTPEAPIPLISNLPAGTYKTKDWKGDWWEFTLTDDLCGIGAVSDSVEWDKYSPAKGFQRKKNNIVIIDGSVDEDINLVLWDGAYRAAVVLPDVIWYSDKHQHQKCSHFTYDYNAVIQGSTTHTIGTFAQYASGIFYFIVEQANVSAFRSWLSENPITIVHYRNTEIRTPLTFTKNNASTATEVPMEFLTDTPSGEYPAEVFDASGTVKVRGKNKINVADFTETLNNHYFKDRVIDLVLVTGTQLTLSFDYDIASTDETIWYGVGYSTNGLYYNKDIIALYAYVNQTTGRNYYTFTVPAAANGYKLAVRFVRAAQIANATVDISNVMISTSTDITYEPYRPEVTSPIPPLRSNQDGTVYDEFEVKSGKVTRKTGRIESYNGEDVGDDWISSTGALDTGATVEYVLAEPIEEQHTLVILPTYYPQTIVTTTKDTVATLSTTVTVKTEDE